MVDSVTPPRSAGDRRAVRDRFLSEFVLALVEGVELREFLHRSVAEIGRILEVDRTTLFLFEGAPESGVLVAAAAWHADGIEALPAEFSPHRVLTVAPTVRALRPLAVTHALGEPELASERDTFEKFGTKSILIVPIAVDGVLRGLLNAVTVRTWRAWADDDIAFLSSAVYHFSTALKQTELVTQLARERDRLRVLVDLASAVQRSTTVQEVIDAALTGLEKTLEYPIGTLALLSQDGQELVTAGAFGDGLKDRRLLEAAPVRPPLGAPKSLGALALERDEPIVVVDVENDLRVAASRDRLRAMGARSVAVFPLRTGSRTLGVLTVGTPGTRRRIDSEDVATVQTLAGFVSVALDQRRAAEELERAAREAQALSEASRALLTRTADRELLLNQIIDGLVLHFGQENCSLLLVDDSGKSLVPFATRGSWQGSDLASVISLDSKGLIPTAARDKTIVNVPDVLQDPRYLKGWSEARSELVVPLLIEGEVVGVLDLQSSRPGAFTLADARTLTAFADRAALALRLADLVRELEERTRVLEALARATQLLNFRLHAPDVLSSVVEETSRAFPSSDGCIAYVADAEGRGLTVAAVYGVGKMTQQGWGGAVIPLSQMKCAGRAFRENRPALLEVSGFDELALGESAEARARARAAVENPEVRHLLAVPIRVGSHRLGVIEILACRPKAFTPGDAETLVLLAEQAAIALRNARLIEELQRSNRLKDDFLANLSHEVRTPLTGIVGWAEVLLDSHREDPQVKRALEAILGQADTLSRMLADLIDLSRIDNFGLEIRRTPISLNDTLNAALDAVGPTAAKKGVKIECEVAPDLVAMEGDSGRLKQVVWNLLSNSVKFSPPGSTVRVIAQPGKAGGIELLVKDEGCGIDPAFLPHVFDRFRQEETSSNRRFGGLGVGLAIARAIVLAHGGTIDASSDGRDKGSLFRVAFPQERISRSGIWQKLRVGGTS